MILIQVVVMEGEIWEEIWKVDGVHLKWMTMYKVSSAIQLLVVNSNSALKLHSQTMICYRQSLIDTEDKMRHIIK